MKNNFIGMAFATSALAFLLSGNICSAQKLPLKKSIRIMSYNVRNGVGLDNRTDLERIGQIIKHSNADVVAIQEVDSATKRSKNKYVLREIANEALMYPTFAGAIPYDGGKYGVGVLSKEKPISSKQIALPGHEEKRTLLITEFKDFILACTHLSLTEADRRASLAIIAAEASKANKPFFLAGDWNATENSEILKEIKKDFKIVSNPKQHTFPADKPDSCLDYIAVYKPQADAVVRTSASVREEKEASDHRPVITDILFKTPAKDIFYSTPYLQNPTNDGITVMFQTNVISHCWVEYGMDTLNLQKTRTLLDGQEVCYDIENKIRLNNLQPGKTYYYRVCAQEIAEYHSYSKTFGETARTSFYSFHLPKADQTDFTALIFNDLHENYQTFNALKNAVKDIPIDFIVFNGDCLPEPTNREYAMYHINMLARGANAETYPTFFIRGNHEIRNAYSAGMHSLFDYPGNKTYGAFSWGDTRFVMLDCGEDKPDDHWVYYGLNDFTQLRKDQAAFLQNEIKSKEFKKAKKQVLIHHIPLWGNDGEYNPCLELWGGLLQKTSFNINICAHTHSYKYHPKGEKGNPFPVIIGGGPGMKSATVMVLSKKGNLMTLRVFNPKGELINTYNL